MPYKTVGRKVMHKKNGWTMKAKAKSAARAKRQVNLLRAVKHGWVPTGKPARGRRPIFTAKRPPGTRRKRKHA